MPDTITSPTIASLANDIVACEACTARQECDRPTPFYPRTAPARILVLGRNPGINEDRQGLPFVGRGGQILEAWLQGLGITREDIWLTNTLKCYTAADRKPKAKELSTCWDLHLSREIGLCRPDLIVALGAEAFQTTTGLTQLTNRHGILYDRIAELGAYVMGVIHPGSALRSNLFKDMMIEDAKMLKPLLPITLAGTLKQALPDGYTAQ